MKCIDDELIQRYLDSETDAREVERIEKHVAVCASCARNIEQQRIFADGIKKAIGQWGRQAVVIPEFVAPVARKRKIRHYIYAVSAACAVLCFVFLLPERNRQNQEKEIYLIYGFDGDFDANRTISQQNMTIMLVDANGRIVEYN